jgi:hypothetical protein
MFELVGDNVAVKVAIVVPLFPSGRLTLLMVKVGGACTVIGLLVASLMNSSLARKRAS